MTPVEPLTDAELERLNRIWSAAPDAIYVDSCEREFVQVIRLLATITALKAENERLREALKPFADMAPFFANRVAPSPRMPDDIVYEVADINKTHSFTVGDLRRAAEACER